MEIIGTIIAIIIAIIGGVLGTVANVPAMPAPVIPAPVETVAVDATPYTPAYTSNLPEGAYNIIETESHDRTTIDYNIVNGQGDVCTVSTVYYNNGTVASGQRC